MPVEFKDYYQILGVSRDASDEEIKKAFRKLARRYHPDVAKDKKAAEEKFKEINRAGTVRLDVVRAARRHSSSGSTAPASAISLNNFSVTEDALVVLEASVARKPSRPGEPHLLAAAGISKAISWLRLKRC